jgi:hypothetical protein
VYVKPPKKPMDTRKESPPKGKPGAKECKHYWLQAMDQQTGWIYFKCCFCLMRVDHYNCGVGVFTGNSPNVE